MNRDHAVNALRALAKSLGPMADGTEWHLFGSVDRNERCAHDIDLMILCQSDAQADALRQAIDCDGLVLPLDLSLLTFEEARTIDAIALQRSRAIFP